MEHVLEEIEEPLTPAALARTVQESREMIARGDYSEVEEQLIRQAVVLENMFQIYFEKTINTEYHESQRIFGQLALKAQSQCRKTLQALLEVSAPKQLTFIKQQNNAQINVKQTSGDS